MSKQQRINEAMEAITEAVGNLEDIIFEMPIRTKVKDIIIKNLCDWHEEVNDAITLSPTDW